MSIKPENANAAHDVCYLTKHPQYELALEKSASITPDMGSPTPLVQLRFTAQTPQHGVILPLATLTQLHDALGRLLDYVQQEHARRPTITSSGSSGEDFMASVGEQRHLHSPEEPLDLSHPTTGSNLKEVHSTAYPNRSISIKRLCRLSGVVLTAVMALFGWALYSLSPSQAEFSPGQGTVVPEPLLLTASPAMRSTDEAAGSVPAQPANAASPALAFAAARVADETPAQIYLHIQSPAQHKMAQRLVEQLQEKGYVIPKGAILDPKGPARTEVRYFSSTEAEEATAIAMLINQPHRAPATSSYIRGRKEASKPQPRRYEIWLGPEPHPTRIRH
jgi:hypothetical protein